MPNPYTWLNPTPAEIERRILFAQQGGEPPEPTTWGPGEEVLEPRRAFRQMAPTAAGLMGTATGRTIPWTAPGVDEQGDATTVPETKLLPIMEQGGVRGISRLGNVPSMTNPPPETAGWTPALAGAAPTAWALKTGTYPGAPPGTYSTLTGKFTSRAEENRLVDARIAREQAAEDQKNSIIQGMLGPYREAVRMSQSFDPRERVTGMQAVEKMGPTLMNLLRTAQEVGGGELAGAPGVGPASGAIPGIHTSISPEGKITTTRTTPAIPEPKIGGTGNSPESVFAEWSRPGGPLAGRTFAGLTQNELASVNAESNKRTTDIQRERGLAFGAGRPVPVMDSKTGKAEYMPLIESERRNKKEPGRYVVLGSPGGKYAGEMAIVAPWNIHPWTKADSRIPVDVNSLNRLDAKISPQEVTADAESGQPSMVLVDKRAWTTVIAPIRGVWKSYKEVSDRINKQLGVTTADAAITRLQTGAAAALGSSTLAVDINAQISHAIRMIRAMGVLGNLASEQIEREIAAITVNRASAGTRQDVAAQILMNTESQVRNFIESMTNTSDFTMKEMGQGGAGPTGGPPSAGGGGGGNIPRLNSSGMDKVRKSAPGTSFTINKQMYTREQLLGGR